MAQMRRKNVAARRAGRPSMKEIIARAHERVKLPDVGMDYDYQDDVDMLSILFDEAISPSRVAINDEKGVMGIYKGKKLIGVEILDITGGLRYANPT